MRGEVAETLLVVAGETSHRRSLAFALTRAGYRVHAARTGEEALSDAARLRPALALIDVGLLKNGGAELLVELERRSPGLAALVVTDHGAQEAALTALERGVAACLLRPMSPEALLQSIAQLLERRRLILENRRLAEEVRQELGRRHRAEAERDFLVKAVESAGEAIVVTDVEGTVLYANPAFEAISGYPVRGALGRSLGLLDGGEAGERSLRHILQSLGRGGIYQGRLSSARRDGEPYQVGSTITQVGDERSEDSTYVHVRQDVTERLRLEAVAQAVNTMHNIGYVFAGIRHELGNPINSLRMTLKLLADRLERYDPPELRRYFERMLEELSRVSFLIHSLKSFNMYEHLEPRAVELAPFLEQFSQLVRGDCQKRGVSFEIDVRPAGLGARADPRALQQVLLNVLTNALDACQTVEEGRLKLRARRARGGVVLSLKDNGVGMTEQELTTLFRPFVTSKPHGTGLGLVLARKMMSQMDGEIEVTSERGMGTWVTLILPEEST